MPLRHLLCCFAIVLAGAQVGAEAQGGEVVALFAHAERDVVAVGEPFAYRVEAVLAYEAVGEGSRLERQFRQAPLSPAAGVQVEREAIVQVARHPGQGTTEVVRTFWLRAERPGALALPTLDFEAGQDVEPVQMWAHAEGGIAGDTAAVMPVVAEWMTGPPDDRRTHRRIGSAFVVGPDAVATSFHVVVGAERVRLTLPSGREAVTSRVWALDPARDVAILHVDADDLEGEALRPLRPASPAAFVEAGAAFTAGWPGGARNLTAARRFEGAGLPGVVVSQNGVSPGDSGGPLLNERGRVLGVVSFGRNTDDVPDALPAPVCLATDLRPALIQAAARREDRGRPESLTRAFRAVADRPQARALAVIAALDAAPAAAPRLLSRAGLSGAKGDVLAALSAATDAAPHDPAVAFLEGTARLEKGDVDGARAALERSLERHPGYFPATYALAHLAFRQDDLDRSDSLYARLDSRGPYAALGAFGRARIASERGRHADADAAIRVVLREAPEYGPALFLLGHSRLGQGDGAGAEAIATRMDRVAAPWGRRLRVVLDLPPLAPSVLEAPPGDLAALAGE